MEEEDEEEASSDEKQEECQQVLSFSVLVLSSFVGAHRARTTPREVTTLPATSKQIFVSTLADIRTNHLTYIYTSPYCPLLLHITS